MRFSLLCASVCSVVGVGLVSVSSALAAPTIGTVSPDRVTAGVPATLSASVYSSQDLSTCRLYVEAEDVGAMTISGGQASMPYNFRDGGVHTVFVFCRDSSGGMAAGPNTSVWAEGALPGASVPFGGGTSSPSPEPDQSHESYTTSTTYIPPTPTPAPTISVPMGSLIKLACADGALADDACHAVYYYGFDGKRHAFPNNRIFSTWYENFDSLVTVSAETMGQIPLGRNVLYRPGARMVKFTTDPKVYAIGRGGLLRWIPSESAATDLYGADWNKKIDDLPDTFFTNYQFGTEASTGAYSPTSEMETAKTIDAAY